MARKNIDIFYNDMSARLNSGVKLACVKSESALWGHDVTLDTHWLNTLKSPHHEFKAYLFPLSSMTEKQCEKFNKRCGLNAKLEDIRQGKIIPTSDSIDIKAIAIAIEWLNENHFDHRGLIKMGFAIDATNLNIYE